MDNRELGSQVKRNMDPEAQKTIAGAALAAEMEEPKTLPFDEVWEQHAGRQPQLDS